MYGFTPYYAAVGHYDSIADTTPVRLCETAFRESASPKADGLDAIMSDRKDLIRSKIEMLLIQLDNRKAVSRTVLNSIDYESCQLQNLIFEMEGNVYQTGKSKLNLERMKFDLGKQKRMELVGYFRDTARLNGELKDALLAYQKEVQSEKILEETN